MGIKDIIYIAFSYFIGAIPSGYLLAKYGTGIDIREFGSGNIGATNMARILGKKFGTLTLLADLLKSFFIVWLGIKLGFSEIIVALSAFMALIGNGYSIFLGFKGGKGVATSLGIYLALSWKIFLGAIVVYVLFQRLSKVSAVGSLAASVAVPFFTYFILPPHFFYVTLAMSALIIIKHSDNIRILCKK